MILNIATFSQIPPHIARQMCQCGGDPVYEYVPNSDNFFTFKCRLCGKDRIAYWYQCNMCQEYFHKNPTTFSHPAWDLRLPMCWSCLEEHVPNEVCLNYPDIVIQHHIRKGKRPPAHVKKRHTKEELAAISLDDILGSSPFN